VLAASGNRGLALAVMPRARTRVILPGTREHRSTPKPEVQVMAQGTAFDLLYTKDPDALLQLVGDDIEQRS
jgi:hypothetical protein